ncbi:MAG: MBL fold metallo-hydrolase, partial [Alphaproteobacteria bacterium]|nr:MBL fold metallo-hydrolase [Alphaproteobacteria bacterium]
MRTMSALIAAGMLALGALAGADAAAQSATPTVREITKIAGEVYRFRNNNHFSVFVVTPTCVIATNPINADAARWLKAEMQTRFNQPVEYLVYSHDHADHISGGEVFADTAIIVGHENVKPVIQGGRRPTPPPHVTFSDRMVIELGGTVVELTYVGRNHSDNSLVMRFPREKIAFAVDFIPIKAMAFRDLPDAYMPDWVEAIKRVEAMDFDVFAPGHGPLGNMDDVRNFRVYLEELRAEVLALARQGKTADEVKQAVKMAKYSGWAGYEAMQQLNFE